MALKPGPEVDESSWRGQRVQPHVVTIKEWMSRPVELRSEARNGILMMDSSRPTLVQDRVAIT